MVTLNDLTGWFNMKAMMVNVGKRGGNYSGLKKRELMAHLFYLLHSISPSPQIEMKFKCHDKNPVNVSDICNRIFGIKGVTRHKEFKDFLRVLTP